jgi:hypothetical protein
LAGKPSIGTETLFRQTRPPLFLDYKRSADEGAGRTLSNRDRSNLAKAISGFGNSEGGVILWGVDCRNDSTAGDVPTGLVRIQNPTRFKSWLEQATTGLTVPPHDGVRHHAIPEGFVVTLIPSGMHAPYQTVGDLSYYIRAGSNFARTPNAVLSGLFGRRPQPSIKNAYLTDSEPSSVGPGRVKTQIGILLHNFGRGIAENVFINLTITSHPGRLCELKYLPSEETEVWWGRVVRSREMQLIMRPGYLVPPEAHVMPVALEITLQNPIESDFAFEGICGSAGGEPTKFKFKSSVADIVEAFDRLAKTPAGAPDADSLRKRFNKIFYKAIYP